MLYWFRTPPGVKVGRAALDEEAIRLIEQLNPGMAFDWPRIMKGQGSPATEPRLPAEGRRQRPENRRPPQQTPPPPARAAQPARAAEPARPRRETPGIIPGVIEETSAVELGSEPGAIDPQSTAYVAPIVDDVPTPAHARIGAEGVQRLRARYTQLLTRISERTADETRQVELKQQADRLNPDSWVTDEQVAQGLEQYEAVFATLREVGGQQRRRRRRGKGPLEEGV